MTTGITTNLDESRLTIIGDALLLLGVIAPGEAVSSADEQLSARFLNRLIKQWQGMGIHVWSNADATVFLQYGSPEYTLGNETQGGAHWAESPISTALSSDAAVAATTINVDSTVGMLAGDHIGIVDNTNAIQWTTITTVTNATTLLLGAAIITASDTDNYVFSYTSRPSSGAPLRILDANRIIDINEQSSTTMIPILAFNDFFGLTNRQALGTPINICYQKNIDTGTLQVWNNPNDASLRVELHYTRPLYNFDSNTNTADISPEWLQAIIYNLAVVLAPAYGAISLLQALKPMADEMLHMADDYDQENISLYVCGPTEYRW